jgi:hypothetical protein
VVIATVKAASFGLVAAGAVNLHRICGPDAVVTVAAIEAG